MKYMKENVDKWTKDGDYWYSIYSTPSESLTDRFCRGYRKFLGIVEMLHKEYYTNSYHYDVRKIQPIWKIRFWKRLSILC